MRHRDELHRHVTCCNQPEVMVRVVSTIDACSLLCLCSRQEHAIREFLQLYITETQSDSGE